MNNTYYDAVTKMDTMNINPDYKQGWIGGYLHNPEREEQRVTEAYSAGYEDGQNQDLSQLESWIADA